MEFQSRSRRHRGGCRGNNGRGHLSCVAALSFAYNGFWGPASGGFLFSPLLSGDSSGSYNRPFVPPPPHFLPAFNPPSLLLFLPLLSVLARKQNTVENVTIHSPPELLFFIKTFGPVPGWAPFSCRECDEAPVLLVCKTERGSE